MASTTRTRTTTSTPAAPETDPIAAADAEAARAAEVAQEAADRAAKLRAEKEATAAAREAAKLPHIEAWEDQERAAYPRRWRGKTDQAWADFVSAVRDGGDVIAAWTNYRVTRRLAAADLRACERWAQGREQRLYAERLAAWQPLKNESIQLDTQVDKATGDPEIRRRLEELRVATSELVGTPMPATSNREGAEHYREVWRAINAALNAHQLERPRPHGAGPDPRKDEGFSEALRRVLLDLEDQAVKQAAADRAARRTAYVEDQVNRQH